MMKLVKTVGLVIFTMFGLMFAGAQAQAGVDDLEIITESYPPYNFIKDGQLQGISVELMGLILERLGSKQGLEDIKLMPWARGYQKALLNKNICIFSMTRNIDRNDIFQWVGPIDDVSYGIIARKDHALHIESYSDLKSLRIAVVNADVNENLLLDNGFELRGLTRVSGLNTSMRLIKMLQAGRVDAVSYNARAFMGLMASAGINSDEYENIFTTLEAEFYFAFSKDVPRALVESFQQALDDLKEDGSLDEIVAKYLP